MQAKAAFLRGRAIIVGLVFGAGLGGAIGLILGWMLGTGWILLDVSRLDGFGSFNVCRAIFHALFSFGLFGAVVGVGLEGLYQATGGALFGKVPWLSPAEKTNPWCRRKTVVFRRLCCYSVLVLPFALVLVWIWQREAVVVPHQDEVQSMVATVYFYPSENPKSPDYSKSGTLGDTTLTITVPQDHVSKILDALEPAHRDRAPLPWVGMGKLEIEMTDGKKT